MTKICKKGLHKYTPYKDNKRSGCWECRKLYMKIFVNKWQKENRKKCRLINKKWRENNIEYNKKRLTKYQKENSEYFAFKTAKRRKIIIERTPKWLIDIDWEKIKEFYYYAKLMTETLNVLYEVDHIIPLQGENISGLHCPQNLQILTEFENISKHNKFIML